LGFTLVAASIPATTARTWLSLGVIVVGALALAAWVFLRAQGVETWEATPLQRRVLALGIVAIALAPVLLADTNYDAPAPPPNDAPAIRALFSRAGSALALAAPGGQPPGRCCSTILNRETAPYGIDEETRQDLLLLLPVDASQPVTDLRIELTGENGLQVTADPEALARAGAHLETRTYAGDLGPAAADGHHVVTGWIARVPVTLMPTRPWDIGGARYPLRVTAAYRVGEEHQMRTFSARGAIDAQVSSAIYEMGAASLVLPFICLGAAFTRWRRTR
jgi:hypothetical protein